MTRGSPAFPIEASEAQALFAPLKPCAKLAIAVSGGADSVALMGLMARWAASVPSAPRLHVLTVDHRLRVAAAGEARAVADWAAAAGLEHTILTADQPAPHTRIQAWARGLRYRLMGDWVASNGADGVVLAHHLEDQAETVVMRLARGSALSGLGAMRSPAIVENVRLFRPLLAVARARLLATVRDQGHDWFEDPGNSDPRYERVRMRQAMAGGGGLAAAGLTAGPLAATAARLARADAAIEVFVARLVKSAVYVDRAGYATVDGRRFDAEPEEIRLRVLARLIGCIGGRPPPLGAGLEGLLARLDKSAAGTLGGCRVGPTKAGLMISRELRNLETFTLSPGGVAIWDGRFQLKLDRKFEPIDIRPLGERGFAAACAMVSDLRDIPDCAGRTVPGGFRGSSLVAPPVFSANDAGRGLNVEFCRSN